ncbi:MAG TPA: membrane protein insertase YidC [Sphaerochaeta sp.]|nr:membrane protein insertase YidC [Sphaerochaeta sp.]
MGTFLYNILVYPIEMIVEFVYGFFDKGFTNVGLSIAAISVIVNLLALPLYNIAESLQKKERDVRIHLQPGITRIKTAFKGDEQYMMLSTFYRQNNYHPAYALRSSVSLIIQVPFFIAAYHFLSNLEQLQGQSFAFIPNLGSPDGLLSLGGISLNLLPIIMTIINIIAGAIYTKGFPLRDKVQLYAMAGLFLVLLYASPAGLVLYWTLNNVFSLIKNIFYKLKNPLKIFYSFTVFGAIILAFAMWMKNPDMSFSYIIILVFGCGFIILLPLIIRLVSYGYDRFLSSFAENRKQRDLVFVLSALLLFFLNGVVVPANLISSSPIEFSFTGIVENPLAYVANTAAIFFGIWVVWGSFIYVMANKEMKAIFSFLFCCLSLIAMVNLFIFKGDYGLVTRLLEFENSRQLEADGFYMVVPFVILFCLGFACLLLIKEKRTRYISSLLTILVLATAVSGLVSCTTIQSEFKDHEKNVALAATQYEETDEIKPVFHLSREGKNVVYLFLDRAFSFYFPYIHEQFPEMEEQFKGFVYYPNTVSFGRNTRTGASAMVGGYEYTSDALNARSSEKQVDKHNESLLVLPKIFLDGDYSVTLIDPPDSNFKWEADFTPFLSYPDMKVMQHSGKFSSQYKKKFSDVLNADENYESTIIKKRMPLFSILKTTMPILRRALHKRGSYYLAFGNPPDTENFLNAYAQLHFLPDLTDYEGEGNTYTFIGNNTPHEPLLLQAPNYEPQAVVTDTHTPLDDNPGMDSIDIFHYHSNAAALRQIGAWFEELQEAGVYDNTRIIIVADHGFDLYSPYFEDFDSALHEYSPYNPLMLFKDFDAEGIYKVDNSFMTNADAPLFAIQDLDVSSINPFTGSDLNASMNKEKVNVYTGDDNDGYVFDHDLNNSYSIHSSIFEASNWTRLSGQETE